MAKASKATRTETVTRPVEVQVDYVSLELTFAEARTLLAISARIAGYGERRSSPGNPSPRMHMDNIGEAISAALGRTQYDDTVEFELINDEHKYSNINFNAYEDHHNWTK